MKIDYGNYILKCSLIVGLHSVHLLKSYDRLSVVYCTQLSVMHVFSIHYTNSKYCMYMYMYGTHADYPYSWVYTGSCLPKSIIIRVSLIGNSIFNVLLSYGCYNH